jgi:hypothetical protein
MLRSAEATTFAIASCLPKEPAWPPAGAARSAALTDGRVLDFAEPPVDFPGQHYAFLVSDDTFDAIMERIRERGVPYWADPQMRRPGEINANHGGGACTSTTRPATTSKPSPPATTVTRA